MAFYDVLVLLHALGALIWVGGVLVFAGMDRAAGQDRRRRFAHLRAAAFVGPRLFAPAGLLLLVTGITMTWLVWGLQSWIVAALALVAVALGIGAGTLGPVQGRAARLLREGDEAGALASADTLRRPARLEATALVCVVLLMLTKPAVAEMGLSLVVGVVLATLAVLSTRRQPAPAA